MYFFLPKSVFTLSPAVFKIFACINPWQRSAISLILRSSSDYVSAFMMLLSLPRILCCPNSIPNCWYSSSYFFWSHLKHFFFTKALSQILDSSHHRTTPPRKDGEVKRWSWSPSGNLVKRLSSLVGTPVHLLSTGFKIIDSMWSFPSKYSIIMTTLFN